MQNPQRERCFFNGTRFWFDDDWKKDLINKFGADMPEIVVNCDLDEAEQKGLAQVKDILKKTYEQ